MDDKLTDPSDIASREEDYFRVEALRQIRQAAQEQSHPDFDGKTCLDCANDIPNQRLALGKIRCVDCQELIERPSRLFGRG